MCKTTIVSPVRGVTRTRRLWSPLLALSALMMSGCGAGPEAETVPSNERGAAYGLVVHGGAGTILPENLTPEREAEYLAALEEALGEGYRVLEEGGSALDAVSAAVIRLEDAPLFNAGRGAVFTAEGTHELDAAIMDGRTLNAGAVGAVRRIRNPIELARLVMEESPHVFLVGEGAETFGRQFAVEEVEEDYFFTEERWQALQRALDRDPGTSGVDLEDGRVLGTVGAAALDRDGNLAAATSTGGMTAKRFGRIGDVPVVGAGTYANNRSCAVSTTGHGEFFIRNVVAYDICARMLYTGASLEEAANAVIHGVLVEQGGTGGAVAIDREGSIVLTMNTPGMYRGYRLAGEEPVTRIYRDD